MLALFAALTLVAAPTPAVVQQQSEWELLGTRQVNFRGDKDVISVTRKEGTFRAIKIEVAGGNLDMHDIRVVFGDGSSFSPETRVEFREGSWSRTIDLPGTARVIRSIEFNYRSELKRGRATVRVFGRQVAEGRVDRDDRPAAEPRRIAGWDRLGSRSVSFKAERDVVSAEGEGLFRRVMIVVDDADLELFDVKVVFANGEVFSPETRLYFKEDSRTRVIDLPGEARAIRRIEFSYRSVRGGGDGKAEVHVYGQL